MYQICEMLLITTKTSLDEVYSFQLLEIYIPEEFSYWGYQSFKDV